MTKRMLWFLALLMLVVAAASCGGGDDEGTATATGTGTTEDDDGGEVVKGGILTIGFEYIERGGRNRDSQHT